MSTLYRKYRPQKWSDVAGQEHVKATLAQEVSSKHLAHAYLFAGPRGVGKTTLARILAKAVNCERATGKGSGEPCGECASCVVIAEGRTLDVIEIDAASHRGIDSVRENVIENARFAPSRLAYKVFIIDEVHMLTAEAWAALLKTLEEPPERVIFVLATTELHKVPMTILSRCQRFDFRRIPFGTVVERLERLAADEGVKVDRRALEDVARLSDGCLRDAESLLGKMLASGDGKRVTYDEALLVLPRSDRGAVAGFVEAVLSGDGRTALSTLDDCLEQGMDLEQFADDVTEFLRRVLLVQVGGASEALATELDPETARRIGGWAKGTDGRRVIEALELLLEKRRDLKSAIPAQLPLELVVARLCVPGALGGASHTTAATSSSSHPGSSRGPELGITRHTPAGTPLEPSPAFGVREVPDVAAASKASPAVAALQVSEAAGASLADIRDVRAKWVEIMKQIGERSASLTFILGTAEPIEIVGATIRVGVRFPFHCEKIKEQKNREVIEDVLSSVLGVRLQIEPVLLEKTEEPARADGGMVLSVDPFAAAFGGRVVE